MRSITSLLFGSALLIATAAQAQDYRVGDLRITDPQARATAPAQPAGAVYMTLENLGKTGDKLVAVASPVAKRSEIHSMSMQGDVMRMRAVPGIELAPAAKVAMQPGDGYHIMLIGLKQPLKQGDKFPLTLTFEKAGTLEITASVGQVGTKHAPMKHGMPAHSSH